jgi:hypothetical protein
MTATPTLFRTLLVSSFLLGFIPLVPMALGIELLSPAWEAVREAELEAASATTTIAVLLLALPALGLAVASTIGLFFFKRWARPMALVATALTLVLLLLAGMDAYSGLETMLDYLSSMLWGACLAMAYWSPLSGNFDAGVRAEVRS